MRMLYAVKDGSIYESDEDRALFRSGRRMIAVDRNELIPMPYGSYLFTLPGRFPLAVDDVSGKPYPVKKGPGGEKINAVAIHCASAYLRTLLPAYGSEKNAPPLPLWAYAGVALVDDEFYVPAFRIDDDKRSDPELHENPDELNAAIAVMKGNSPGNRLVSQLAKCSTEYTCLCARNFFLGRFEAPLPTSPTCNSRCYGCLSHQPDEAGFASSQFRLTFKPTPDEIAEVITRHFRTVPDGVASFGQGCEGEPLLRSRDLADAVRKARQVTATGTINMNSNGSRPEGVREMIKAGLDSLRVSLNSPTREYYDRYYRPRGYVYSDVLDSIRAALDAGIFVSVNLFFFPGFTDMEAEVESLIEFLKEYPVHMIQTRNMNIDPDLYLDLLGAPDEAAMGIPALIDLLKSEFPQLRFGYYNPPVNRTAQPASGATED